VKKGKTLILLEEREKITSGDMPAGNVNASRLRESRVETGVQSKEGKRTEDLQAKAEIIRGIVSGINFRGVGGREAKFFF